MKTAKRRLSQQGLSPIIIVVILAVIGAGAFALYNSKNSQQPSTTNKQISSGQTSQTSSKSIAGLEKIETDTYTFSF